MCCCLYLYYPLEIKKILGPSFERLLEEGFWFMVFSREGEVEKIFPPVTVKSLLDFSLASPFY